MKRILLLTSLHILNIEGASKDKPKEKDPFTKCYSPDNIHILIRELQSLGTGVVEAEVMARQAEIARVARLQQESKASGKKPQ